MIVRNIRFFVILFLCLCYTGLIILLALRASKIKINRQELMHKILEVSGNQLKGNQKRYEKRKLYLSQMGANYFAGRTVLPEEYFLLRVSIAFLFAFLTVVFFGTITMSILCSIFGFLLPDLLLQIMNDRNNTRILKDIKSIFDTIKIKTQGGMFLTSAITECYRNTRNRRLKQALYEMSGQIIAKQDLVETIDSFNIKFKNKYIDTLCIILKQSLDSGKTVEIMESIQDQLTDMQEAVNLQIRNKLNAKVLVVQILLYAVIIVLCICASVFAISADINLT